MINTRFFTALSTNAARLLLGVAMGGCFLGACATTEEVVRPRFSVKAETLSGPGPRCGQKVLIKHGALEEGVRENARYQVTVSKPVALSEFEALLEVEGARVCADGVMVQQAVASEGAEGINAVTATAYVNQPDI